MKKLVLGTLAAMAAAFLATTAVQAADLPSRAPPPVFIPPAPIFTWTGFYIGAYAGGSFEGSARETDGAFGGGALRAKRSGFTGGGLLGANYQFSRIVVGIEGEGGFDGEKGRASDLFVTYREKSDGFVARVRGRVGYAAGSFGFGETLLFIAGGGSFSRSKETFTDFTGFTATTTSDRTGFNIGGGLDLAFTNNIIGRVEYIYDDFGRKNLFNATVGPYTSKITDNTVRAALMYKF